MDNEQSEDVQFNEPIALYKVSYLFNNELFSIDLILNKNNKKISNNYPMKDCNQKKLVKSMLGIYLIFISISLSNITIK